MNVTTCLVTAGILMMASRTAYSGMVDLRPDENGDRIAVVNAGNIAYLPAKRANIGSRAVGAGYCRYIRRSKNGDLYVTGPPNLGLFCSKDGGQSWTSSPLNIKNLQFVSAFAILDDDTFLIAYMPPPQREHKHIWMARSTDYGKTWQAYEIKLDLYPCKYVMAWNGDMIQLADGKLLLTLDMRVGPDAQHDEEGKPLPVQLRGGFLYVVQSRDGGKTWGDKSMIPGIGGEVHLLQLPSGKLLACVRKQRHHRMPGDPAEVKELKLRHGYRPEFDNEEKNSEYTEDANRIKNMFVSESYDGGYTWVNEQQVSGFLQCSGDMSYLKDGTLVLQYLHRYDGGPIANRSIRARVSYDDGKTWEPEEYILSDGENYPGGIDMPDGGMISMCPHRGQIQAVHWRPLPKGHQAFGRPEHRSQ